MSEVIGVADSSEATGPTVYDRHRLTDRQLEVVRLYAPGTRTMRAVGARLGIAEATVGVHLRRVYRTLGVGDRLALLRWAMLAEVVDIEDWLEGET